MLALPGKMATLVKCVLLENIKINPVQSSASHAHQIPILNNKVLLLLRVRVTLDIRVKTAQSVQNVQQVHIGVQILLATTVLYVQIIPTHYRQATLSWLVCATQDTQE